MAFNSKLQATLGQRGFARDNCLTRDSRSFGATVELLKFHCQEHKAVVLKRAVEFFFHKTTSALTSPFILSNRAVLNKLVTIEMLSDWGSNAIHRLKGP